MANVHVLDHPLIQHKLAILRSKRTGVKEFREIVGEIAGLMCYEATRNLPTREVEVETPLMTAKCRVLAGKKLAIVPILRAGLGMVDSMVSLIPSAKVGHIGLYRDPETHKPVEYYCKHRKPAGVRGGPHAGHGRQRRCRHLLPEAARLPEHHHDEHHRRARGRGGRSEGAPRCGDLSGRSG